MKVSIANQNRFQSTQKQLEYLQVLKAPLYYAFNGIVLGSFHAGNPTDPKAEFCFIDCYEDKETEKLKNWVAKTGNTPGEMEAALEKQFNKLALLLDKYEEQQKELQLSALEKIN